MVCSVALRQPDKVQYLTAVLLSKHLSETDLQTPGCSRSQVTTDHNL